MKCIAAQGRIKKMFFSVLGVDRDEKKILGFFMSRTLYFTVPYSWKMAFLKKFSDFLLYILAFFASVKFVSGG